SDRVGGLPPSMAVIFCPSSPVINLTNSQASFGCSVFLLIIDIQPPKAEADVSSPAGIVVKSTSPATSDLSSSSDEACKYDQFLAYTASPSIIEDAVSISVKFKLSLGTKSDSAISCIFSMAVTVSGESTTTFSSSSITSPPYPPINSIAFVTNPSYWFPCIKYPKSVPSSPCKSSALSMSSSHVSGGSSTISVR